MKSMIKTDSLVKKLEMADIFRVEMADGKKRISRWGFYADQGDGTYAIYRPENPVCDINALLYVEDEDGPGAIDIVDEKEIHMFLDTIGNVHGIPAADVSDRTACGWYYDTIV